MRPPDRTTRFRPRARLGALIGAGLAALALVWSAGPGWPAAADPPKITWSVQPSDAQGPNGRSWVELTLDPGQSAVEHMAVRNLSPVDVSFRLEAADGYLNDQGRFDMNPFGQPSTGAGTWIDLAAEVLVPSGGAVVVPFTVTAPLDASPGDHAAGVAASLTRIDPSQPDAVALEGRVGFRVMLRVTGSARPRLTVTAQAHYRPAWNPFSPGAVEVDYDIANQGNVRLGADVGVELSNPFQDPALSRPGPAIAETLPGDHRTGQVELSPAWPWFRLRATVVVSPRPVAGQPAIGLLEPVLAEIVVWAVPWSQLVALGLAGSLIWAWVRQRRRRRLQLAQLLAQARADGRREAAEDGAATVD
ncbi:MAG: DUF916 domain-containing protein [Propionibacteriaceae bacterium]|jgi:hypothetical protein|nr:DUF916 domain-containing protein [Propionibacteriaceae bacterium]